MTATTQRALRLRPEIDAAVRAQLDKVAHTTMLGLASEPAIVLADRLMKLVPPSRE